MRRIFCAIFALAVVVAPAAAEEPDVSRRVQARPEEPRRRLRRLAESEHDGGGLDWGNGVRAFAGVLRDERGRPIGNCPLLIAYGSMTSECWGELKTDKDGYFVIMPPPPAWPRWKTSDSMPELLNEAARARFLRRAGVPVLPAGLCFARDKQKFKECGGVCPSRLERPDLLRSTRRAKAFSTKRSSRKSEVGELMGWVAVAAAWYCAPLKPWEKNNTAATPSKSTTLPKVIVRGLS